MKNKAIRNGFTLLICLLGKMAVSQGQNYCAATSKGAGNLFGGNITAFQLEDDTGVVFAYNGFTNNSSSFVINPTEVFDVVGGEFLTLTITGNSDSTKSKWWTRCGIWIDANRNGDFGADECISDPQKGPCQRLVKDSSVVFVVHLPSILMAGKTRIRIRGCDNSFGMTAYDACGAIDAYGNQFDFEVNAYYGVNGIANDQVKNIQCYPNPAKNELQLTGIHAGLIRCYDNVGKAVFERNWVENDTPISLENLENGWYQFVVITEQGQISRSVLVQH